MITHNICPLPRARDTEDADKLVKETVAEWKERTAVWKLKQAGSRQLRRETLKTQK